MAQSKAVTITIGKYGMPINAQIKDETEDKYLFAFQDPYTGNDRFQLWYAKDIITFHNQGEHE